MRLLQVNNQTYGVKKNFKLIKDAMKTSGVIVTYSSSGKLKDTEGVKI